MVESGARVAEFLSPGFTDRVPKGFVDALLRWANPPMNKNAHIRNRRSLLGELAPDDRQAPIL
jgi:hypothetical protein